MLFRMLTSVSGVRLSPSPKNGRRSSISDRHADWSVTNSLILKILNMKKFNYNFFKHMRSGLTDLQIMILHIMYMN